MKLFFNKLFKIQDYKLLTSVYANLAKNNIEVDKKAWNYLAEDVINYANLYNELKDINRLDLFPNDDQLQEKIAKSMLYNYSFNFSKDTLEYITKKEVTVKNEAGYVYFFKSKKPKDDNWSLDYIGLQPLDLQKVNTNYVTKEKNNKIAKDKNID